MAGNFRIDPIDLYSAAGLRHPSMTSKPAEPQQGLFGDTVDALQMGAANTVGGMFDMVGVDGMARSFRDIGDAQLEQMSQSGRESLQKEFFTRDEQGSLGLGEAATDLDAYLLNLASAVGGIGVTIPLGGALGAVTKTGSMIGMGATGGAAATGMQAEQARREVFEMDDNTLRESPKYAEVMSLVGQQFADSSLEEKHQIAKASIAEMVANDVKTDPKTLLANFAGSALADPIIGKALTGARIAKGGIKAGAFRGLVAEGGTEAGQAGVSQYSMNEILQPLDNRDLSKGVTEAALTEGVLGGIIGAGAGSFNRGPVVDVKKGNAPVENLTGSDSLNQALNSLKNNVTDAEIVIERPAATAPNSAQSAAAGEQQRDEDRRRNEYWASFDTPAQGRMGPRAPNPFAGSAPASYETEKEPRGLFETPTVARKQYDTEAPTDMGRVGDNILFNEASTAVRAAFGDAANTFRQINQGTSPVQQAIAGERAPSPAEMVGDQMVRSREEQAALEAEQAAQATSAAFADAARTTKMQSERWQRRMPAVVQPAMEGELNPAGTGVVPAGERQNWDDVRTGRAAFLDEQTRTVIAGQDPTFNPDAPAPQGQVEDRRPPAAAAVEGEVVNTGTGLVPVGKRVDWGDLRSGRAAYLDEENRVVVAGQDPSFDPQAPEAQRQIAVNLRASGKPFNTGAEAMASTAARTAKAEGADVVPVKVEGGFGWADRNSAAPARQPESMAAEVVAPAVEPAVEQPQSRRLDDEGRPEDGKPVLPGDVFVTATGRQTSPYPKQKSAKASNQWLIDNAVAEARARGNKTAERNFLSASATNFTPADRDSMLVYLNDDFDVKPDVRQASRRLQDVADKAGVSGNYNMDDVEAAVNEMEAEMAPAPAAKPMKAKAKSKSEKITEGDLVEDEDGVQYILASTNNTSTKFGGGKPVLLQTLSPDGLREGIKVVGSNDLSGLKKVGRFEPPPESTPKKSRAELLKSPEYRAAEAWASDRDAVVSVYEGLRGWEFEVKKSEPEASKAPASVSRGDLADEQKVSDQKLLDGEMSIMDYLESRGYKWDDVTSLLWDIDQDAKTFARESTDYGRAIAAVSKTISAEMDKASEKFASTPQERKTKQSALSKWRRASETLDIIQRHFENPFNNSLMDTLPAILKQRHQKLFEGMKFGEAQKELTRKAVYRYKAQAVIDFVNQKNVVFRKEAILDKPVTGLPTSKVMSVVDDVLSKIGNMNGIEVEVVATQDRFAMGDRVKGFYVDGKVVLIAENLTSSTDVRSTLLHELLAHGGLDMVLGKDASQEILQKIMRTRNVPAFKDQWAWADRNYAGESDEVKAEEIFAKFTETAPEKDSVRYWWNNLVNTIKRMLTAAGLWTSDMTRADMQATLDAIRDGFQVGRDAGARAKPGSNFGTGNMGAVRYSAASFDEVNDPAMRELLKPAGQAATIGAEKGRVAQNGISKLTSDTGSTRYVYAENGKIVSALQVMSRDGVTGTATNVYTDAASRRKGLAAQLYQAAEQDFDTLKMSSDLSKDGAAWASSVSKPKFSKTADYETMATPEVDEILKKAHSGIIDRARDAVQGSGVWDRVKANWTAALTLSQLAEVAGKLFPGGALKRYNDVYQQYVADVQTAATDASFLANDLQKWAAGNKDQADMMFELAHDATIFGIDADPKVSGDTPLPLLEQKLDMLRTDLSDAEAGGLTERAKQIRKEIRAVKDEIKDYSDEVFTRRRGELQARFNAMTPEAQEQYRTLRKAYQKRRNEAFSVQRRELEKLAEQAKASKNASAYASSKKALTRLGMEQRIAHLSGPYFPLTRFGDYFTDLRRPDGERVFLMHESESELKAAVKAFEEAGWTIERKGKTAEFAKEDGMSAELMDQLGKIVDNSGLENDAADGLKDQIFQMYLQYLPSRSIRKNLIHRKNVRGFSQDAVRAFALSMSKSSNQIARMKHMPQFTQALRDANGQVREYERTGDTGDAVKSRYLLEELRKRHENIMNPSESKVSQAITGLGFSWLLGLSPAAAVINLTQTATIAAPVMAAKLGVSLPKAMALLTKELRNMKLSTTRSGERLITLRNSDEIQNDPNLRAAYNQLEKMGVIDLTRAHDLVGISETGGFQYGGKFHKAMSFVSKFFHNAEVINREITAIAIFKQAFAANQANGMTESDAFQDALKTAADLTRQAHFDYSSGNRARFMQGNVAKVAFQFKQYSQQTTYYLVRNAWRSLPWGDLTVAERKEARAQLFGTLMTTGFIGGLSALPLSAIYALINALVPDDEDEAPFDAKQEFYTFLAQNFGKDLAQTVIYGAGGAGLSSRIQLNDLWLRDPAKNLEGAEAYGNYVLQLLGPVAGGIIPSMVQGASLVDEGEYQKGVEKMIPKAFKDISVTQRYADEGATNLRGDVIKEDFNFLELFLQANGLADSEVTARYEENAALKGVADGLKKRRQSLMDRYYDAKMADDQDAMTSINEAITSFNQKNPTIRIDRRNLLRSMKARKKRTEETKAGLYLDKDLRYLEEQIDWL